MQEKIWKIQASYTVEASYIMSMVILSLAVLIRAAYGQYLDKTSLFLMNYAVERLYGQEERSFAIWFRIRKCSADEDSGDRDHLRSGSYEIDPEACT